MDIAESTEGREQETQEGSEWPVDNTAIITGVSWSAFNTDLFVDFVHIPRYSLISISRSKSGNATRMKIDTWARQWQRKNEDIAEKKTVDEKP